MYFDNCKRLIAFGDSLTYGHGIFDADNERFEKPSDLSWVNTVGKHFNLEVHNKAMPGSGNDSMLRVFNEYILGIFGKDHHNSTKRFSATYQPGDAVIVGLSNLYRVEVYDYTHSRYDRILVNMGNNFYDKTLETSVHYVLTKESPDSLLSKMLQQIHTITTVCKQYNIPVIIFHALPPIDGHTDEAIQNLKYIPPSCQTMVGKLTTESWMKRVMNNDIHNNLGRGAFLPCGHPNEQGQKFWGDKIIEYIEAL